ncbi:unnamed protein product [Ixodes pacificus]
MFPSLSAGSQYFMCIFLRAVFFLGFVIVKDAFSNMFLRGCSECLLCYVYAVCLKNVFSLQKHCSENGHFFLMRLFQKRKMKRN